MRRGRTGGNKAGHTDNNIIPAIMTEHSEALAGHLTPRSVAAKGNERGNDVWEVKIPSCWTFKTKQAGLTEIYTEWMKIVDKTPEFAVCSCSGSQCLEHLQRQTLKYFTWKPSLFIIFPPYFGHTVALTCFYNVKVQLRKRSRNKLFLLAVRFTFCLSCGIAEVKGGCCSLTNQRVCCIPWLIPQILHICTALRQSKTALHTAGNWDVSVEIKESFALFDLILPCVMSWKGKSSMTEQKDKHQGNGDANEKGGSREAQRIQIDLLKTIFTPLKHSLS